MARFSIPPPHSPRVYDGRVWIRNSGHGTTAEEVFPVGVFWKSDGTAAGTMKVKDINPGTGNSNPDRLAAFHGALYFEAGDVSGRDYLTWEGGLARRDSATLTK